MEWNGSIDCVHAKEWFLVSGAHPSWAADIILFWVGSFGWDSFAGFSVCTVCLALKAENYYCWLTPTSLVSSLSAYLVVWLYYHVHSLTHLLLFAFYGLGWVDGWMEKQRRKSESACVLWEKKIVMAATQENTDMDMSVGSWERVRGRL
jgi:hypothetical protein